jgi:Tol biopolymer transport system component
MRFPLSERRGRTRRLCAVMAAGAGLLLFTALPAKATFLGVNGKIAFSTDQGPDPQIFVVNPDGSGEKQVTKEADGHAVQPAWSRDGSKIIFSGDQTGNSQIYEMNATGSGRTQLLSDPGFDDFNPRFSPDDSEIAFTRCAGPDNCAINLVKSDGTGPLMQLTSSARRASNPDWSPDGTKIAFDSNQDGLLSAVWVMDANGGTQQRLTAPALEAFKPDWSPDGKHIIFNDLCCLFGSNQWVMNPNGSGQKQLTHFPTKHQGGFGIYSPDGKKIVLIADLAYKDNCCSDLYTMDASGTHMTKVVSDQPGVFFSDWGTSP